HPIQAAAAVRSAHVTPQPLELPRLDPRRHRSRWPAPCWRSQARTATSCAASSPPRVNRPRTMDSHFKPPVPVQVAGKKRRRSWGKTWPIMTIVWHMGLRRAFWRRCDAAFLGSKFANPPRSRSSSHRLVYFCSQVCQRPATGCRSFATRMPFHPSDKEIDEDDWKSFCDSFNETLELPSISVPARHVNWLISDNRSPLKPYLATHMAELEGVHPKIKVVRDCEENGFDLSRGDPKSQRRKRILLDSKMASEGHADGKGAGGHGLGEPLLELTRQLPGVPKPILQRLVEEFQVTPGEPESVPILYQHLPAARILSKILPPEAHPPPASYEQVGHIAHVNLRQAHVGYGKVIGRVLLDSLQPSIRTVVNKRGEVGGPYRTYQMDLLAGNDDYFVHVVEHGASLRFDLKKVYWCTRLEGERTHMIEHEFLPNQVVADAFCGVGALCIRAAIAKGCAVLGNDLNPDAAVYCEESARRNGIDVGERGAFRVRCGDASQFIMNLRMGASESSAPKGAGASNLPDHLLLNFPLDSPSFLDALRWWPSGETDSPCRVHVYTFARGDEERTAAEVAVDMVADGLLPEGGYVEPSKFRGEYLNELGCSVEAREIRDAAPGKLVICVSFSATGLLLRRMQGDYGSD
ncbi:hypothetical protein ACHAWF_010957, partial [Thalassiosira exigua]